MRHAVVVGGGIGGLSAAAGLHAIGWEVTVLERAPEISGIGAGISLWPNALRSLTALGVGDAVAPHLAPQRDGGLHDRRGATLTRWDAAAFERHHGGPLAAVHRADLIGALRSALPGKSLRTAAEVTDVRPDGLVRFAGGELRADLIVAADGINSPVRQALFPAHPAPVYSGSTAFRGMARISGVPLSTSWGRGTEVGVIPLTEGRVYWWAGYVSEPGIRHDDPKAYLAARFGNWHDPIPELIAVTPPEALLHHDIHHLAAPLPHYTRGRIALLGDAAHAMPPYLGQGGCQAIEDAVVLAAVLSTCDTVDAALHAYDGQRRPRSQRIARSSVQAGKAGPLLRNPVAVAVRNTVTRLAPAAFTARVGSSVSGWTPPRLRRPAPPRTR